MEVNWLPPAPQIDQDDLIYCWDGPDGHTMIASRKEMIELGLDLSVWKVVGS